MIGITERGDSSRNTEWLVWTRSGKPAILITKDSRALYEILAKEYPIPNVIVHCTITGFGGGPLEPNVPSRENSLNGFKKLIDLLGEERVVLRVDPIIPTKVCLDISMGVIRAAEKISSARPRIRISFLDNYPHVKRRFSDANLPVLGYSFHAPLEERKECLKKLEDSFPERKFEVCGEPGMSCSGCISSLDTQILGVSPKSGKSSQRKACQCLSLKKELLNSKRQCSFGCLYCYWRT